MHLSELPYLISVVNLFILPLLGFLALMVSKLSRPELARTAERHFLAALVVMTLITLRTVIRCDDAWLSHTATLAVMIVGALSIPGQRASVAV